jgi:hypothetical protein
MKILITGQGQFTGDNLETGKYYECEAAETGTSSQNKTFHALISAYFVSGCFSYPAKNSGELKQQVKKYLGAGFESYVYILNGPNGISWGEAKRYKDIPPNVAKDKDGKPMIRGKLLSWAKYTKTQRRNTIDNLIAEMIQSGVQTRKFYQILEGMEKSDNRDTKDGIGILAAEAMK